jgi:opine dehydrogenase
MKLTVCGAGNSGKAIAGDAALAGYDVCLYEMPEFSKSIAPIMKTKLINIYGPQVNYKNFCREGVAKLRVVTTDMKTAIKGADVIAVSVQSVGYEKLFKLMIPYLENGQIVLIMPDNYGTCVLRKLMKETKCTKKVIVAGTNSIPYAARLTNNSAVNQVFILYRQTMQTIDTFPSCDWNDFWKVMQNFEPYAAADIKHGDTIIAVNPDNLNPIIHVPSVLLNAGAIDNWGIMNDVGSNLIYYSVYRHGFSNSVSRVQYAFYEEEMRIAKALGIRFDNIEKDLFFTRLSLVGPLVMGSKYERKSLADQIPSWYKMEYDPNSRFRVDSRYITEDVPVGCRMYYELGKLCGVKTPLIESLINIGGIVVEKDYFTEGFNLELLGLGNFNKTELINYLRGDNCL